MKVKFRKEHCDNCSVADVYFKNVCMNLSMCLGVCFDVTFICVFVPVCAGVYVHV